MGIDVVREEVIRVVVFVIIRKCHGVAGIRGGHADGRAFGHTDFDGQRYDGKITGNTSGDGGAIYLNQEPSWLIMQGGEISGNTATGNGGGVYIYRAGSV